MWAAREWNRRSLLHFGKAIGAYWGHVFLDTLLDVGPFCSILPWRDGIVANHWHCKNLSKPYVPEGSFGDVSFPSTSQLGKPSVLWQSYWGLLTCFLHVLLEYHYHYAVRFSQKRRSWDPRPSIPPDSSIILRNLTILLNAESSAFFSGSRWKAESLGGRKFSSCGQSGSQDPCCSRWCWQQELQCNMCSSRVEFFSVQTSLCSISTCESHFLEALGPSLSRQWNWLKKNNWWASQNRRCAGEKVREM